MQNNVYTRVKRIISVFIKINKYNIEINTKVTLGSAQKLFVTKIPALFITYTTYRSINDENDDPHTSPPFSLALITFCRWRHNRLPMTSQLVDSYDASSWKVISNSSDVDFIHGYIHDRSCKKTSFFQSLIISRSRHCIHPMSALTGVVDANP